MSVQLVVYPQWYDGILNPISGGGSGEMLSDTCNFTGIDTGSATHFTGSLQTIPQQAIDAIAPTMAPNTWYGYYKGGTLVPLLSAPTTVPINLEGGGSGVFQKMSGLAAGGLYNVDIDTYDVAVFTDELQVRIYNGTTLENTFQVTAGLTHQQFNFVAPSIDDTVVLLWHYDEVVTDIIECVSVTLKNAPPPGPLNTQNGSVICDLYEDEDIPLTLSVDNFKNAAEKVQSYSKAFNLPATKRNNQIFDNIFEITRYVEGNSILFNPLKRTKAVLKQDGILIFEGYLRMLDISEKEGEISYNVNLYAEVTALADTLKDKTFQDLGFTELEHDYNRTNIELSWNTSGSGITYTNTNTSGLREVNDTVKYPFVDWNHQMVVSDGTYTAAGNPQLTKLEQAFRPFIQIKYLLDRIFQDSQFTYTSTFFDTNIFAHLYMDFNWGADDNGAAPVRSDECRRKSDLTAHNIAQSPSWTNIKVNIDNGTSNNDLWDNTNYKFTSDVSNLECSGSYRIQLMNKPAPNVDAWTTTMRFCKFNEYGVVLETFKTEDVSIAIGGSGAISGSFSTTLQANEYLQLQATTYNSDGDIEMSDGTTSYLNINYNNEAAQVDTLLDSARADVNQWEFLKGIMTMFNLVTLPDPQDINNLIIETYEHIFIKSSNNQSISLADRGITHNWTDKVDYSTMKIAPLSDLSGKTIFKFVEDDDDHAFKVYKRDVQGHLYGSKVFDAVAELELNLLTGEEEVVAEPFAATVIKPLMDTYTDFVVPSLYAMNDEGETEGFENSPRIMYNDGLTTLSAHDYWIPEQNGVAGEERDYYLGFSHLSDMPTASHDFDFHFGVCQLVPPWVPTVNNLFQMYWMPYYSELYDSNTRVVTVKINLNAGDINTFKFNDQVMIKNRAYRVNKIDYKPNDFATVELILLNYI